MFRTMTFRISILFLLVILIFEYNADPHPEVSICSANNGGCQHECVDGDGAHFRCLCRDGFKQNGTECKARDCNVDNGWCMQKCLSGSNDSICGCSDNFTLAQDGEKCLACPVIEGHEFQAIEGACYWYSRQRMTYDQALTYCKSHNLGHLAKLHGQNPKFSVARGRSLRFPKNLFSYWVQDLHSSEGVGRGSWIEFLDRNDGDEDHRCLTLLTSVTRGHIGLQKQNCSDGHPYICQKKRVQRHKCEQGWFNIRYVCFKKFADKKTFEAAEEDCKRRNASLVLPPFGRPVFILALGQQVSGNAQHWIGILNSTETNHFVGINGVSYRPCYELQRGDRKEYRQYRQINSCNQRKRFICQKTPEGPAGGN